MSQVCGRHVRSTNYTTPRAVCARHAGGGARDATRARARSLSSWQSRHHLRRLWLHLLFLCLRAWPGTTALICMPIHVQVCWIVFVPWWAASASVGTMLMTFFISLGALLTVYNYYKAIYTSPGHPPANWVSFNCFDYLTTCSNRLMQLRSNFKLLSKLLPAAIIANEGQRCCCQAPRSNSLRDLEVDQILREMLGFQASEGASLYRM